MRTVKLLAGGTMFAGGRKGGGVFRSKTGTEFDPQGVVSAQSHYILYRDKISLCNLTESAETRVRVSTHASKM